MYFTDSQHDNLSASVNNVKLLVEITFISRLNALVYTKT